jgi:hypothetical protein
MRLDRWIAVLPVMAAMLAACVPTQVLPATCGDPSVTLQATLVDERLEPATLEVCRDQRVRLVVAIQRDGVFHVHGYDDQLAATEVHAGESLELSFTTVRSGQFPIALHTTDGPAEVTVGVLIVHEP